MKKRYNPSYYLMLLINLLLLKTLLMGCITTGVNKKDVEDQGVQIENQGKENDDQINNVKISEFILGVGDTIEIIVYRHDELSGSKTIGQSGKIMYPLIGDIVAAGKGVFELRDELLEKLSKYLVDPQLTINVTSIRSKKIMVLGEVKNPGVYNMKYDISIIEAISNAGGTTGDAKMSNVLVRRGANEPRVFSLNLKKAFGGDVSQNITMQNGDVVYLPPMAVVKVGQFLGNLASVISPFSILGSSIITWDEAIISLKNFGDDEGIGGGGGGTAGTQPILP